LSPARIGLDLDNTLIDYSVSARVYAERLNIGEIYDLDSLRNALRTRSDQNWQEAQAWIYTLGLKYATPAYGWFDFLLNLVKSKSNMYIVSHKTRFTPDEYGRIDLHYFAQNWLEENLNIHEIGEIKGVFFESSRKDKIERISVLSLDYFVDDLIEVLENPKFPIKTRKFLYDPHLRFESTDSITSIDSLSKVLINE
jgi:hypothetical protein